MYRSMVTDKMMPFLFLTHLVVGVTRNQVLKCSYIADILEDSPRLPGNPLLLHHRRWDTFRLDVIPLEFASGGCTRGSVPRTFSISFLPVTRSVPPRLSVLFCTVSLQKP